MEEIVMKRRFIAGMAAAALAFAGCGSVAETAESAGKSASGPVSASESRISAEVLKADTSSSSVTAANSDGFTKGAANFSAEMFKHVMAEQGSENVLISPESVLMCMGMVANGAEGETLDELTKTLIGGDLDTLNSGAKELFANQNAPELKELFNMSCANSAWIQNGLNVEPNYLNTVADVFGADTVLTPMDSSTVDDINIWCSDKTNGMIDKMLTPESIDANTRMVLINAVCFEAEWQEQYEDYQCENGIFRAADGSEKDVTMLHSTESQYVEDGSATGFVKYYDGGYAFMAVLPNEGTSVSDYAASMTGDTLTSLFENRSYEYDVDCKLPEFTYDWGSDIKKTLADMGIKRAFDDSAAQFGGMTKDADLFISKVIHKTHIELDRNGTRAAAVTAAFADEACALPEERETKQVYLDHPFIYTIIDTQNNIPVFIGCVNDIR